MNILSVYNKDTGVKNLGDEGTDLGGMVKRSKMSRTKSCGFLEESTTSKINILRQGGLPL